MSQIEITNYALAMAYTLEAIHWQRLQHIPYQYYDGTDHPESNDQWN
jgi:hypothetical protein